MVMHAGWGAGIVAGGVVSGLVGLHCTRGEGKGGEVVAVRSGCGELDVHVQKCRTDSVVFVDRADSRRVISLRKAKQREVKRYAEA